MNSHTINWTAITREDVLKAIDKFLRDTPEYPEPRNTYLIYDDKKLPAKHIRGMAYTIHYGTEIKKDDFGGGLETVRFFERLGFATEYHPRKTDAMITNTAQGELTDFNPNEGRFI